MPPRTRGLDQGTWLDRPSSPPTELAMASAPLSRLFVRWEESLEQGRELSAEQLCATCPELLEQVRQGIDALRRIRERAGRSLPADTATLPPTADPDATSPPSLASAAEPGGLAPAGYEV